MSDAIKHECGIALIRLRKPLQYYYDKYQTPLYGVNKMYLLMEKQHNRGQDGAGVGSIRFNAPIGNSYIDRIRSNSSRAIKDIFAEINEGFKKVHDNKPEHFLDPAYLQKHVRFSGELLLGHLRYGTYGGNSIEACHPFLRQNSWKTRNLVVAGNFNLTNVDELFEVLYELGQHPEQKADTVTVMEKIGHFLDRENERLFAQFKKEGKDNVEISSCIAEHLDVQRILKDAARNFDGGYAMAGLIGHGDAFVLRDPNGIRPAFYYADEEVVVVASERPAIQTVFNVPLDSIKEVSPGHALIIKRNGSYSEQEVIPAKEKTSCTFERIYFSRGSDHDIYRERKNLGRYLVPSILKAVDYDIKNTVFSFIPNTAEVAFYGMAEGLNNYLDNVKKTEILKMAKVADPQLSEILSTKLRIEKIAIKDAKLRTFITQDSQRDDLVSHVYDTTYGVIKKGIDNLVVIDDSIVRGTTLKQSIIKILDRLGPKKIVIVSSAPQIRYPDCYGIDMAKMGDFIAFQAVVQLLKDNFKENLLDEVYEKAKAELEKPKDQITNVVKQLFDPFTPDEVSDKISAMLRPEGINADVQIIYQSLEGLHNACPDHKGDWYFSGNYPTPGGNRVVNRSFINFMEGKNVRAY